MSENRSPENDFQFAKGPDFIARFLHWVWKDRAIGPREKIVVSIAVISITLAAIFFPWRYLIAGGEAAESHQVTDSPGIIQSKGQNSPIINNNEAEKKAVSNNGGVVVQQDEANNSALEINNSKEEQKVDVSHNQGQISIGVINQIMGESNLLNSKSKFHLDDKTLDEYEKDVKGFSSEKGLTYDERWSLGMKYAILRRSGRVVSNRSGLLSDGLLDLTEQRGQAHAQQVESFARELILMLLAGDVAYAEKKWSKAANYYGRFLGLAEYLKPKSIETWDDGISSANFKLGMAESQLAEILEAKGDSSAAAKLRNNVYDRARRLVYSGGRLDFIPSDKKAPVGWFERIKVGAHDCETKTDSGMSYVTLKNDGRSSFQLLRFVNLDVRDGSLEWEWKLDRMPRGARHQIHGFSVNHPLCIALAFYDRGRIVVLHYVFDPLAEKDASWQDLDTESIGDGPLALKPEYPHIVVSSRKDPLGKWITVKRDVVADYRSFYKTDPSIALVVAVMSNGQYGNQPLDGESEGSVANLRFQKIAAQ